MDTFSLVLDTESFYENLQLVSLKAAIVNKFSSTLSLGGFVRMSKISQIFVEEL